MRYPLMSGYPRSRPVKRPPGPRWHVVSSRTPPGGSVRISELATTTHLWSTSAWLHRRILAAGERPLNPGHVVPPAVLPADAPVGPDRREPHGTVQADACGV